MGSTLCSLRSLGRRYTTSCVCLRWRSTRKIALSSHHEFSGPSWFGILSAISSHAAFRNHPEFLGLHLQRSSGGHQSRIRECSRLPLRMGRTRTRMRAISVRLRRQRVKVRMISLQTRGFSRTLRTQNSSSSSSRRGQELNRRMVTLRMRKVHLAPILLVSPRRQAMPWQAKQRQRQGWHQRQKMTMTTTMMMTTMLTAVARLVTMI
mmetsp:Transcript_44703/g.118327  ORF Transcript_44703/g.118327 Transcript_44703/m.118327 type:complete len:207 (+) Transcript_44703:171-791(+)